MKRFEVLFACSLFILSFTLLSAATDPPSSTTGGGGGGGSTSQPTLTTEDGPIRCYSSDSEREGTNRTCSFQMYCFSYIRRQLSRNNTFRVKRGCSSRCVEERRNRKIQVCCSSHLCNNQLLTPDNFTMLEEETVPTASCDPTTGSCDGRATPSFIPPSQMTTRETISRVTPSTNIKPPDIIPDSSFTLDNRPTPPDRGNVFVTCNCNQCGDHTECVGRKCGTSFKTDSFGYQTYDYFCVNDINHCINVTFPITCCDVDKCNAVIQRLDPPTTGSLQATKLNIGTGDGGSTGRGTGSPDPSVKVTLAALQTGDLYFTLATVVSVVGGVVVVCIILLVLIFVIVHHKRRTRNVKLLRQPSPTPVHSAKNGTIIKASPSPSCSMASTTSNSHSSSNSSSSCIKADLLKHLGTSV